MDPAMPGHERLYAEFSRLFRKYSPEVVCQQLEAGMSFEYQPVSKTLDVNLSWPGAGARLMFADRYHHEP
jgi:hypothetical protein